jgi:hypothetical protein
MYMWSKRSRVQTPFLTCLGEYVKMVYNPKLWMITHHDLDG